MYVCVWGQLGPEATYSYGKVVCVFSRDVLKLPQHIGHHNCKRKKSKERLIKTDVMMLDYILVGKGEGWLWLCLFQMYHKGERTIKTKTKNAR